MTISFRLKMLIVFVFCVLFLFSCDNQELINVDNNAVDNILIYVKKGNYTINDNGKEYKICKCYIDDELNVADDRYLNNGIYYRNKETIFIVFSDYEKKKNYLYRIYKTNGKLKYNRIDESDLAINIYYIYNEYLYYKVGGSYGSWGPDYNHTIKKASVDGKVSVILDEVEGTFVNYSAEINTAIIRNEMYSDGVFGYKNNENIDIERNLKNSIICITPFGCFYNSKSKNGVYYFDGEYHLIIDKKTAYDILPSKDYKKVYIITNEENKQFNLYLYENEKCQLIKENIERVKTDEDYYSPKLVQNYNRRFFNDKEVKIKSYLNTNDLCIYDRSKETYGDVLIKDFFSKYNSFLYNDLNNNLYTYFYDETGNNPSLYKIVDKNENELITNDYNGFYSVKKYDEDDTGNAFYLPDLDINYNITKEEVEPNEPLIYNVPYIEPNYDINISHTTNYFMPYIVEKEISEDDKKEYKQYIAFDIDGELVESNIIYHNLKSDGFPIIYDPIYDKYYYCNRIYQEKDYIFKINIYEISISDDIITDKIIYQETKRLGDEQEEYKYIGQLSDYRIFVSTSGIIYALDDMKLIEIDKAKNIKNNIAINPYEQSLYYIKQEKDLVMVDNKLKGTEIAKNVLEFKVLRNEVVYTTNNREYEVYKYSKGNSWLLMKGSANLYGKNHSDYLYIKHISHIYNKDFFTFDDNNADSFTKSIWEKCKNKILLPKFTGACNLFLYKKGVLKKIVSSYTGQEVKTITNESGNTDNNYAYMEYDLSFIPSSFNDLFSLLKKEYDIKNDEDFDRAFKNYLFQCDTKLYVNFINELDVYNFLINDDIKFNDLFPEIKINITNDKIVIKNKKNQKIIEVSATNISSSNLILPYDKFTKKELKNIKKDYESVEKAEIVIIENY